MLDAMGVESLDNNLIDTIVPEVIRSTRPLDLPPACAREEEALGKLPELRR